MADAQLGSPSLTFVENWLSEDDVVLAARDRSTELGCEPIGPGAGATLRLLAAAIGAKAVVEIGTGTGVSGLWLLAGMHPDGVLTTVDVEAEHQRAARQAFVDAGVTSARFRMINGPAAEVLPRLTDGAYDLVFVDAEKSGYLDYFTQALRLLRPGGAVAFDNTLWGDRVADPGVRDPDTVALRELCRVVRADERVIPALLPVGDGMLVAVKN
jgi:predicted O-methyltransferase YrrM